MKIILTITKSSVSTSIGMIIALIIVLLVAKSCTDAQHEQRAKEIFSEDTVSLVDLVDYSDEANDPVSTKEEYAWITENCPEITFGMFPDADKSKGVKSSDGSFNYSDEYSFYYQNGGHGAGFFECKLNGDYSTLEGTLYLSEASVNKWESWLEKKAELESQGKKIQYDCDDFGMCLIFADNELIYKSPVLHPDGTVKTDVSLNVTGANEIVICVAGIAYFGAPRVTK